MQSMVSVDVYNREQDVAHREIGLDLGNRCADWSELHRTIFDDPNDRAQLLGKSISDPD